MYKTGIEQVIETFMTNRSDRYCYFKLIKLFLHLIIILTEDNK